MIKRKKYAKIMLIGGALILNLAFRTLPGVFFPNQLHGYEQFFCFPFQDHMISKVLTALPQVSKCLLFLKIHSQPGVSRKEFIAEINFRRRQQR